MDNNLFDDLLLQSKKLELSNAKEEASRVTELELPDIKEVREKTGLSQNEFAARLHISPRTLQNWEQGRRYPTGPAATLIRIFRCSSKSYLKNYLKNGSLRLPFFM
jgi:putative transcriptional regulator